MATKNNDHAIEKALNTKNKDKQGQSSVDWYMKRIQAMKGGSRLKDKKIVSTQRSNHKPFIGGMFQFAYDAKTKEKLPYWDAFPLVIVINGYSDGILGLNLHYLPLQVRARILDELIAYEKTTKTGSNGVRTYMQLSYNMLKQMPPQLQFCIKRYLFSQIKSKVMRVESTYWEDVAFLPTQQFQKASAQKVWKDAKKWQ